MPRRKRAPDQGPVGFDEAQRPGNRHIPDEGPYVADLFEHPIEELRTVVPIHEELLHDSPRSL